jgi:hypothetical protein
MNKNIILRTHIYIYIYILRKRLDIENILNKFSGTQHCLYLNTRNTETPRFDGLTLRGCEIRVQF